MLFGVKLANSIYPPWKDSYIGYEQLKKLLKENILDSQLNKKSRKNNDKGNFTDHDENLFVAALDAELTKVYSFQCSQYDALARKLDEIEQNVASADLTTFNWSELQHDLEELLAESRELDHFARINYTGFQKIIKKHDRLHPEYTSVRALLTIRLKELPFHSEDYSPILTRISALFSIYRTNSQGSYLSAGGSAGGGNSGTPTSRSALPSGSLPPSGTAESFQNFQSFKFWIHPDNLMEVKTRILRHLPVLLVYDTNAEDHSNDGSRDPQITALYFDNPSFELYNMKLLKSNTSPTLRLRWSGELGKGPDIFLEKKTVDKSNDEDAKDIRLKIKEKYLKDFVIDHKVQDFKFKTLEKYRGMGSKEAFIKGLGSDIDDIDKFIDDYDLQPAIRSIYTRTAFQIPGDDRVRITIDSDITFIREDAFDRVRPIRDPSDWHRSDIDQPNVADPFSMLRKGEFAKFPHSVMEIQVKNTTGRRKSEINGISIPFSRKHGKWIEELTTSHLVKEVPNFSKFIQGIASLFLEDESLDILPFWLPELEDDIRQDPNTAFEEEQLKKTKQQDMQSRLERLGSNAGEGMVPFDRAATNNTSERPSSSHSSGRGADIEDHESSDEDNSGANSPKIPKRRKFKTKRSEIIPFLFGGSKLANVDSEDEDVVLPQGVNKPKTLLKQAGPVKIEAKVWLANERTFNRWLHVTTLFSVLTFSIYSSVKRSDNQALATKLAYCYFGLTLFTAIWGYFIYTKRLTLIKLRDGKHLDAPLGPLFVALALVIAITVNFVVGFKDAATKTNALNETQPLHPFIQWFNSKIFHLVGAEGY